MPTTLSHPRLREKRPIMDFIPYGYEKKREPTEPFSYHLLLGLTIKLLIR